MNKDGDKERDENKQRGNHGHEKREGNSYVDEKRGGGNDGHEKKTVHTDEEILCR